MRRRTPRAWSHPAPTATIPRASHDRPAPLAAHAPSRGFGPAPAWAAICFFGSGAAGLLYEVVWPKDLFYLLGDSLHAVATVVALALGARFLGTPLARRGDGARAYALLEAGVGLLGVLSLPVLRRHFEQERVGPALTRLHALNTIGAVAGSVAGGFALLPGIGLAGTTWAAAGLHAAVALLAWSAAGDRRAPERYPGHRELTAVLAAIDAAPSPGGSP